MPLFGIPNQIHLSTAMLERKFRLILFISHFTAVYSAVVANVCSSTPSCNCTLTDNSYLDIVCNSIPYITSIPVLNTGISQTSITQLRLTSSLSSTRGPLTRLPTNICLYSNLVTLDLSSNNINGLLNTSELACLTSKIRSIDFSFNFINNVDKNIFKANTNLQWFSFSNNNLTRFPIIDGQTFFNFPYKVQLMNFSHNQIGNADLWPLFVETNGNMTIDLSFNQIENYTNEVLFSMKQLTKTPERRSYYLNNNRLQGLSDVLLEQYDACPTDEAFDIKLNYFIVGIANILLINNPIQCDCQAYRLLSYIQENINDFPEITANISLITHVSCPTTPFNQYIMTDFTLLNNCDGFITTNITNIFCSLNANDSRPTITPPYQPVTTPSNINHTTNPSGSNNGNSSDSSTSIAWYIILGVVLGIALLLAVIIGICYFFRHKLLPKGLRSRDTRHKRDDDESENNSRHRIIGNKTPTGKNAGSKALRRKQSSMSASIDGYDDDRDEKRTQHSDDDTPSGKRKRDQINGNKPDQETQTNFLNTRSKPPTGQPSSTRIVHPTGSKGKHTDGDRESQSSIPTVIDTGTNTMTAVKGIPISAVPKKPPSLSSNANDTVPDTSTSELSVSSIPQHAAKRAKPLPQVKSGIYADAANDNLLNTSAGALVTTQRQRRRSSIWFRKHGQNLISPLPPRPNSMVTQKTTFDHDGLFDEDLPPIPTIESLTTKAPKPLRTVPLLNISAMSAWNDPMDDTTMEDT